jgi:subtilase family serine protease
MTNGRWLLIRILLLSVLVTQPVLAEKPPSGDARPPIHLKGNAGRNPSGLSPSQVRHAYGFDQVTNQGEGQTIAIVDAFDDPNIESDLSVFSTKFGLPACTTSNGCFQKIYAAGKPRSDAGWALEMALDVEWAHAIAPKAKIMLVEAATNSLANLFLAVDTAVSNGANVVSMSWGGGEFSSESSYDTHFFASGVTFTASSGDSGNGGEYPASSPFVVSVGGTTLHVDSGGNYLSETAWSGSGGGQSAFENEPLYQATFPIPNDPSGKRGIPDVSYDGDPATGFPVYDSVRYQGQTGWFQVGGTSAGAPQWAALLAIANSLRLAANKPLLSSSNINTALYAAALSNYSANYHDVVSGTNGNCGESCSASTGYDYVTGLGTPKAVAILDSLVKYN